MPTQKLGLPTIAGNDTNDVVRDFLALINKLEALAGTPGGLAILGADGKLVPGQENAVSPPDASITEKGITLLSNAIDGTREDVAATELAISLARQAAIKFTTDHGIGGAAKDITGTNINNLRVSGNYAGERLAGAPTTDFYYVEHTEFNEQYAVQKLRLVSTQHTRTIERRKLGGSWGPYFDVLMQDNTRTSGMDANNLTTPGFYALGGSTKNAAHIDWGMLLVFISGDVIHQVGLSIGNRLSMRTKVGSSMGNVWSSWESYATADINGYIMPTMLPGPSPLNDLTQSRDINAAEYPGKDVWTGDVLAFRVYLSGVVRVYWKEYANTTGTLSTGSQMLVNGVVKAEYTRSGGSRSPLYGVDVQVKPGDVISFRLKTTGNNTPSFWGRIDEAYIGGNIIRIERTL